MRTKSLSRRGFLRHSFTTTAALALAPSMLGRAAAKRTAVDQVTLGQTGIKSSRLGMGTGSDSGHIQHALGQEGFNSLIKYAYDQGITYFDCAQAYATFDWMGDAIKGLPREKLFIQSKIPMSGHDMMEIIDHHRKVFDTDYIDSMLVHCMITDNWTETWKRALDTFNEAKDKGWIHAKGVSCHSLPALRQATTTPWTDIHLVRVNPQGHHVDGMAQDVWDGQIHDVGPVMAEIKTMRAKGRGIIGMKIIGNGEFVKVEDREKSVRFAMSHPDIDAVVIGFKNRSEVDQAIDLINRALA